jgi:hypothetical protein
MRGSKCNQLVHVSSVLVPRAVRVCTAALPLSREIEQSRLGAVLQVAEQLSWTAVGGTDDTQYIAVELLAPGHCGVALLAHQPLLPHFIACMAVVPSALPPTTCGLRHMNLDIHLPAVTCL